MLPPTNRRLLALVFTTTVTSLMGNSLLSPVIPDILDSFDRPDSDGGLLIAATSLPGVVIAPVIGVLADRLGRRSVLAPCLAIFGLAGLGASLAPTFGLLLLFRFLMGFGSAALVNLAIVLIGDRFEGTERTHWIGVNAGILTVALAVFPVLGGALAEIGNWRIAIAPYSLGVISSVAAFVVLNNERPDNPRTLRQQLGGAGVALRQPAILANIVAASVMFAVIFGVFLAALPTHLDNEFGLSSGWRGAIIGLPAVTSSIAAFNLSRIRQRWSIRTILLTGAALWLVAFLVMGSAPALLILVLGTLLYGSGEGAMVPSMQNSALDDAPPEHRAVILASWTGAARLGQTVGPLAAAVVIAGPGTSWALACGAIGAAMLLLIFARATKG